MAAWTTTLLLATAVFPSSPAPDVAVAPDGTAAVAYRGTPSGRTGPTFVRIADRGDAFGRPQRIDRFSEAEVAAGNGGRVVAVLSRHGEITAYLRPRRGAAFNRRFKIARTTGSFVLFDIGLAIDARGDATIAWSGGKGASVVRARVLRRDGTLSPTETLGSSDFVQLSGPVVNARGDAAVAWTEQASAFQSVPALKLATREDGAATFAAPVTLGSGRPVDPDVAIAPDGTIALAYLDQQRRGDVGSRGQPALIPRPPGGPPALEIRPELPRGRGLMPRAGFSGGKPVLLYQEKEKVAGFSVAAPLKALTLDGKRYTLDSRDVQRPVFAQLDAGRLLSLSPARTWRARILSSKELRSAAAPPGRPYPYSDASGNRAAAAGGDWAIVAYEDRRGEQGPSRLRVALRRF